MTQRLGVALSGGVDSAFTASLLLSGGYSVFGLHLLMARTPEARLKEEHARNIASRLNIDLQVLDIVDAFSSRVVSPFCQEYAAGRTPNPCITCNRDIKFGLLLRMALDRGADKLATGHYSRIAEQPHGPVLQRALDARADQSYFLYSIEPSALSHVAMPLGTMLRTEVRFLASQQGFVLGRSSQDICFIGSQGYRSFLAKHVAAAAGDIVDIEGRVLGRHPGLHFFTIGQRHGLGVALGTPAYVVYLDAHRNRLVVGEKHHLMSDTATLHQVTWLVRPESRELLLQARTRYRARTSAALVSLTGDVATVHFQVPQKAVAPGQSVVFYDKDTVVGGGIVAKTHARARDAES